MAKQNKQDISLPSDSDNIAISEEADSSLLIHGSRPKGATFIRYFGILIVFLAVLVSSISFLILTGATDFEPSPKVWTIIWIVNGILVLLVLTLVFTEIILLMQASSREQAGAKLLTRMVSMFAFMAVIPALIVAIVAIVSLNQGLDHWFSERTRSIVESSRLVARSYMLEHAKVLRDDIIWIASELEDTRDTFASDRERYQHILTALAVTRSLPFTSLISKDTDILMNAQINVQAAPPKMPLHLMKDVKETVPTLISPGATNLVGAVIKLKNYDDIYLFVARPVDPEVLEYMRLTDDNISEYREYASNRIVFQITFALMYAGLAFVLLLAAVWIGIAFANRFVDPIRNLMIASNKISKGDLNVLVPTTQKRGDLYDLSVRFNRMVEQLRNQREELTQAYNTNEKRRQFTEAVVEGVSSGIVGLDSTGLVTLMNATAINIFGKSEVNLLGENIAKIIPELAPLLERALQTRQPQMHDQILLGGEQHGRTYRVRLTREGTMQEPKGYVITLDDMTELVAAQRNSAWADVARRIAHEIKNPLTPIQLSAERLRRRYSDKLSDDFEIFDKCITTIVKQVGDIGNMVDEFSSFARMPTAVLVNGDLGDTIRQATFLERVRQPQIAINANLPEKPIMINFDDRLISQVITNLIKNSIEAFEIIGFSNIDNPEISIDIGVKNSSIHVSVSDNAKGWPSENRHRLLEPYMTTREKGTGLGLAIVAKIIEQHGGEIFLSDAKPDQEGRVGACFTFTIPTDSSNIASQNFIEEKPKSSDNTLELKKGSPNEAGTL
jgi:two-component system nitrogen regulation sensor histidine kinase NtrY